MNQAKKNLANYFGWVQEVEPIFIRNSQRLQHAVIYA